MKSRTTFVLLIIIAVLSLLVLMTAKRASAEWQLPYSIRKGLWPNKPVIQPPAPVIDEVKPVELPPVPVAPPIVIDSTPPSVVVPPKPRPVPIVKPKPRVKSTFVKPRRKTCDMTGPDLPWACWQVRWGSAGKTRAQLVAEGKARGISLSCKQIAQAEACLTGAKK